MSMVKFLVGVGVGVAGKFLYDAWQESQQASSASHDGWEDESPETAQTEQREVEVPDDLSATMDTQTNELTQDIANTITDTPRVQPAA